jgi:aminoglycoside 3-N-acetyltransferase
MLLNVAATVTTLTDQLLALGVRRGGALLVHSSLRSLGPLEGGAETVISALLEALGPQGTLLFPALSYAAVTSAQPFFSVLATPSCVGALPEFFRTRPGTLRSAHPTHSVSASGRLAAELTARHRQDTTPVGPHSPFALLPTYAGQILFIGCGLRPNTSMHGVEEHIIPPYLFGPPITYTIRAADGSESQMTVRSHNFKGVAQRYDRIAALLSAPALRRGPLLKADCFLIETAAMWPAALQALQSDPLYFVEPVAPVPA